MIVKFLGRGYVNRPHLEKNTRTALAGPGRDATVEAVTDDGDIAGHVIMTTPWLAVDARSSSRGACRRRPRSPRCCPPAPDPAQEPTR